jgi:hypothetical protein
MNGFPDGARLTQRKQKIKAGNCRSRQVAIKVHYSGESGNSRKSTEIRIPAVPNDDMEISVSPEPYFLSYEHTKLFDGKPLDIPVNKIVARLIGYRFES